MTMVLALVSPVYDGVVVQQGRVLTTPCCSGCRMLDGRWRGCSGEWFDGSW